MTTSTNTTSLALFLEKTPSRDFIHEYKGFGMHPSSCRVLLWLEEDRAVCLLVDRGDGTSVTNASEQIITEIYNRYLGKYETENCFFAETYPREERAKDAGLIDEVIPTWEKSRDGMMSAKRVQWKRVPGKYELP